MAKKVVLIVIGAVLALLGTALTVGGAVLLFITNGDGYLGSGSEQLSTPTRALVSEPQVLGSGNPGDATIRVRITSNTGSPVFVGAGPAAAVQTYLSGSSYDEIRELEFSPVRYTTTRHEGDRELPAPADEPLWTSRAGGTGEQTLEIPLDTPDYRVVVMNADGSPAVDVRASFGIKVPLLRRLGIGLLTGGVLAILVGLALLVWGVRTRTPPRVTAGHPPPWTPSTWGPPPPSSWTPQPGSPPSTSPTWPPPPGTTPPPPSAPDPSTTPPPPWASDPSTTPPPPWASDPSTTPSPPWASDPSTTPPPRPSAAAPSQPSATTSGPPPAAAAPPAPPTGGPTPGIPAGPPTPDPPRPPTDLPFTDPTGPSREPT